MIAVLLDADLKTARNYYHVLKSRLTREGNESLTDCKKLKLVAEDGKRRETDVVKIDQKANPRDHFGKYALIYTKLAEDLAKEKLTRVESVPMPVAIEIVWEVAKMIGRQAREVSESLVV